MPTWLLIAGVIALAVLGWNLYRRLGADRIAKFIERRRTTARMVSRGEFIDGSRHLAVALAVTDSMFFYENSDMQASLDLKWVREIEYDTELATGTAVAGGRVLRLRCYSQTFEFVLPADVVARWHMMMPPRRLAVPAVG
jgi:hypothetical protein